MTANGRVSPLAIFSAASFSAASRCFGRQRAAAGLGKQWAGRRPSPRVRWVLCGSAAAA